MLWCVLMLRLRRLLDVLVIILMGCALILIGVVSGSSVVLMGAGTSDDTEGRDPHDSTSEAVGIRLTLRQGDLIIHPAGTSHANLSTEGEYRYLAFFPRVGRIAHIVIIAH